MRALVTENSRLYRQLLDTLLGQLGFASDISGDIATARRFLEHETYDLILVNQYLEDGEGTELAAHCNGTVPHADTPILLLTANRALLAEDLPVRVDGVVHKQSLQQINDQITRFVESHFDPVFAEGHILFVEDSKTMAVMISAQLEKAGYRVAHFDNAEAAWTAFEAEKNYGSHEDAFDLVITDVNLDGDMNGDELVTRIRAIEDGRGFVPIVAITGDNSDRLRISLFRSGVSDFLTKPVLQEELLVRINNLVTNKRLLDRLHDIRRELYALATTDKLTGCSNRHSLMEYSDKFIDQAARHGYPISIMVIDLDHFKAINDTHGHAVGDIVLRATGERLREAAREGDLVARFGGEEFVMLLNHCDRAEAERLAESVRAALEALQPHGLVVTASIGVTTLAPGDDADFDGMFSAADGGVYAAKENGRNRVEFAPLAGPGGADQAGAVASNTARVGAG